MALDSREEIFQNYLLSIHKWPFLPCSAFSAGFRLRRTARTPHRKPLCGLDQDKNCSFLNWTPLLFIIKSRMGTIYMISGHEHFSRSPTLLIYGNIPWPSGSHKRPRPYHITCPNSQMLNNPFEDRPMVTKKYARKLNFQAP